MRAESDRNLTSDDGEIKWRDHRLSRRHQRKSNPPNLPKCLGCKREFESAAHYDRHLRGKDHLFVVTDAVVAARAWVDSHAPNANDSLLEQLAARAASNIGPAVRGMARRETEVAARHTGNAPLGRLCARGAAAATTLWLYVDHAGNDPSCNEGNNLERRKNLVSQRILYSPYHNAVIRYGGKPRGAAKSITQMLCVAGGGGRVPGLS